MSRLYLLRHAKAARGQAGMRDFDRPLDATGIAEARAIGAAMRAAGYHAEVTLCSSALRTRETLDALALGEGAGRIVFLDRLYNTDASGYLEAVLREDPSGSLLLVGHNPMTEELASRLVGDGEEEALARMGGGFPTCALAVIGFHGPLAGAAAGKGHVEAFLTPADL